MFPHRQAPRFYRLGSAKLSRPNQSRINEGKPCALCETLFGKSLSRCWGMTSGRDFRFESQLAFIKLQSELEKNM